jgi:hypothetical protein
VSDAWRRASGLALGGAPAVASGRAVERRFDRVAQSWEELETARAAASELPDHCRQFNMHMMKQTFFFDNARVSLMSLSSQSLQRFQGLEVAQVLFRWSVYLRQA